MAVYLDRSLAENDLRIMREGEERTLADDPDHLFCQYSITIKPLVVGCAECDEVETPEVLQ
jgi:hypothetical protein